MPASSSSTGGAKPDHLRSSIDRRAHSLGRPFRPLCHSRCLQRAIVEHQHDAPLRQHPQPGRDAFPGALDGSMTTTCRSRCITARSMSPSAARSRRRWRKTGCAPSSPPRRSISASTGAMSISSSMSARRRAPRGLPSASAAPTTAWTSPRRRSSCRPTVSRCMECQAALDANYIGAQDTPPVGRGALDVLAQHVLGMACAEPFDMLELYDEIISASPYADLSWETFERVVDFVATGGYALRTYERYATIRKTAEGRWRVSNPAVAQQYRLNIGTIVESADAECPAWCKQRRGRQDRPRRRRRWARSRNISSSRCRRAIPSSSPARCCASRASAKTSASPRRPFRSIRRSPPIMAASFRSRPISPSRCAAMLADPDRWRRLPDQVRDWLSLQNGQVDAAEARRDADRNLPARQPLLHGRLSLRGPARPPDARHAAHPPAGARRRQAARLRRHRLFARHLGPRGYGR